MQKTLAKRQEKKATVLQTNDNLEQFISHESDLTRVLYRVCAISVFADSLSANFVLLFSSLMYFGSWIRILTFFCRVFCWLFL